MLIMIKTDSYYSSDLREQRQESKWILSCQMNLRLRWRFTKDVVIELARGGVLIELLYANNFVLMSETIK